MTKTKGTVLLCLLLLGLAIAAWTKANPPAPNEKWVQPYLVIHMHSSATGAQTSLVCVPAVMPSRPGGGGNNTMDDAYEYR